MFALQVKIFTEVRGNTSDIYTRCKKKLKYQANDSPTQRNEKHFKLSPNALASEKANFQYNAAL